MGLWVGPPLLREHLNEGRPQCPIDYGRCLRNKGIPIEVGSNDLLIMRILSLNIISSSV